MFSARKICIRATAMHLLLEKPGTRRLWTAGTRSGKANRPGVRLALAALPVRQESTFTHSLNI